MPPSARRPIQLESGTPLATALIRGRTAFAQADAVGGDADYRRAVHLAGSADRRLWSLLAVEHVAGLQRLGTATRALQRCAEYLAEVGGNHLVIRLLQAESRSALADHSGAGADVAAIRAALRNRPGSHAPGSPVTDYSFTAEDEARLARVAGLAAADRGDADLAAQELGQARELFLQVGHQAGVAAVDVDELLLAVRQGDEAAIAQALSGGPLQTPADRLLLTGALKRRLRYEEALNVLRTIIDDGLEPALRFPVLWEQIVLLRLIRDGDAAEQLVPSLRQAASASSDPVACEAAMARLSLGGESEDAVSPVFDRRLQHARRLIGVCFGDAQCLLDELRPQARTDRDIATWYLAAGELDFARGGGAETPPLVRAAAHHAAVGHLSMAVTQSRPPALMEIRVDALRLLGRSHARLSDDVRATECWAQAHRLEESIAGRQLTDRTRMRMLQAVPDEYDERIRVATEALDKRGAEGAAPIVVAMEAARGAAILGRILPEQAGFARNLPKPSDIDAAWRWVREIGARLPRSQVVWLMHATPDRVHHAVIGRGFLHHASVATPRAELTAAIDALLACWRKEGLLDSGDVLELSIMSGVFTARLQAVAAHIGLNSVFPDLPPGVNRIAIVAGDALADVPFAAMTIPGSAEPIGLRFALSDLPCLAARWPLSQRSRLIRGDTGLLVSPPAKAITQAATMRRRKVLPGDRATRAELASMLALHRYRQVRIDSHGQHDPDDPAQPWWLELAPDEADGRLTPEQLQWMDLRGCGTLVLGACESGMAQRRGRDERIGFVRAAVHAGAAAVVAARWTAADAVAAIVLDRFDRYVRYLPRDVALQRALLDVPDSQVEVPDLDHPARWACWTLYGDSGWQTRADPLRRGLRRITRRRRRASRR
ncbi:MAG: CHAT domain-containing protein [Pseudonocardiaceae bacterium]